jgi:hypothetical protein
MLVFVEKCGLGGRSLTLALWDKREASNLRPKMDAA